MASLRLLLVDDEAPHRRLFKRALAKAGLQFELSECGSLSEALAFAETLVSNRSPLPHLAVIDLNLGDGRGTTLIEHLRTHFDSKQLPIMVLSTSALESDIQESLSAGANSYLTKADDIESFSKAIVERITSILKLN